MAHTNSLWKASESAKTWNNYFYESWESICQTQPAFIGSVFTWIYGCPRMIWLLPCLNLNP